MKLPKFVHRSGYHLSYFIIPHEGNNHHPWAIRHPGLLLFVAGILVSQMITNVVVGRPAMTLGFATDVSKDRLIEMTNQERQNRGAEVLAENPALSQAALLKAQDMFAKDYWAHVAPDGVTPWTFLDKVGYRYYFAGENLAKGFQSSSGVIQGWLNSPSHRDNMLNNNYKEIGMAVLNGQLQGESTTLVVQLFGTPVGAVAAKSAGTPSQPAPAALPKPVVPAAPEAQPRSFSSEVIPAFEAPAVASNPLLRVLSAYQLKADLTANQIVLLAFLVILASLFVVDTAVLIRKKILHQHSHSLLHALVIISIIGLMILSSRGVIL